MKTKEQVTKEFKRRLAELLREYDTPGNSCLNRASVQLLATPRGYYESYEIEVTIPSEYDEEGNCLREMVEINLGECFDARDA